METEPPSNPQDLTAFVTDLLEQMRAARVREPAPPSARRLSGRETTRRHAVAAMAYDLGHSYPPERHRRVARDEPCRPRAVDATPPTQPRRTWMMS